MNHNPYSSPAVEPFPITAATLSPPTSSQTLAAIAKSTFLAWEQLRILYIVVLGLITLLSLGMDMAIITELRTILLIAEGALLANFCYFAGPVVETYVRWLGYNRKWVRWFLFVGGTTLTAILAIASIISLVLPNQP